jgi:hypothetical protein
MDGLGSILAKRTMGQRTSASGVFSMAFYCRPAYCRMAAFILTMVCGMSSQLFAAEITTYKDENGHLVYVNSEDRELRAAASRGGAAAALRVIEQRKRALPAIEEYIEQVALRYQVDPKLVHAVIEVESAWNPKARSRKGALGLMQLMPETAVRFGVLDPLDAKKNIDGGVKYLRFLLDRFHENLTYALGAYNAGETAVAQRNGLPPYTETRNYVERVSNLYAELRDPITESSNRVYRTIVGQRIVYTNLF